MTVLERDRGLERLVELAREALPTEMSAREEAGLVRLQRRVILGMRERHPRRWGWALGAG